MKKFIMTFMFVFMLIATIMGYTQKPLFEIFTSSTCPGCHYANGLVDSILAENPGTYSLIKYQVNWPENGDPYYTDITGTRRDYYGVSAVPVIYENGVAGQIFSFDQEDFDSFQNLTTPLEINLTANISADHIVTANVTLTSQDQIMPGLKLQLAVVERLTTENASSNGEKEFHNVMMNMNADGEGVTLEGFSPNQTQEYTYTIDMNNTFAEQYNDLTLVAFIQNDDNKQVLQSQMTDITGDFEDYTVTINVSDSNGNIVPGAEFFMQYYGTKFTDEDGNIVYENVVPGTYNYDVIASGLFEATGTIEVTDSDVSENIVMGCPTDYFYEGFETDIPEDWTIYADYPDYLYWYTPGALFFRQSNSMQPLMLISPEVDLTGTDSLFYSVGEQSGVAGFMGELAVGFVTDPSDPTTFTELTTIEPTVDYQEYSIDISEYSGPHYLAFMYANTTMAFYVIDYIRITQPIEELNPPTNVNATQADNGSVVITWEAPTDSRNLTGYKIYKDEVEVAELSSSELTYTDENPEEGNNIYGVSAVYDGGESEVVTVVFYVGNSDDVAEVFSHSLKNYPNPFNPETEISFVLPKKDFVSLAIYNMKGQKIRTLANRKMRKGNHNLIWKGKNDAGVKVSSGIYFYKLTAGKTSLVKKMTLLK